MNFKNSVMPNWGELFFDSSFIVPIQGLCPASAELASRREVSAGPRRSYGNAATGFRTTANCWKTATKAPSSNLNDRE
jgi:hypothetical protein